MSSSVCFFSHADIVAIIFVSVVALEAAFQAKLSNKQVENTQRKGQDARFHSLIMVRIQVVYIHDPSVIHHAKPEQGECRVSSSP